GLDRLERAPEGRTFADDLAEVVLETDLFLEILFLLAQAVLDAGDSLVRQRILHRDGDLGGNLLQELDVAGLERIRDNRRDAQGPQAPTPRRQRQAADRLHAA